jgi:hypothetical protein
VDAEDFGVALRRKIKAEENDITQKISKIKADLSSRWNDSEYLLSNVFLLENEVWPKLKQEVWDRVDEAIKGRAAHSVVNNSTFTGVLSVKGLIDWFNSRYIRRTVTK